MKKSTSDDGSRGPCADVAVDTRHQTAENGVPYARGPRIGRRVGPWLVADPRCRARISPTSFDLAVRNTPLTNPPSPLSNPGTEAVSKKRAASE